MNSDTDQGQADKPKRFPFDSWDRYFVAFVLALAYGLVGRLLFGLRSGFSGAWFTVLSLSFLAGAPLVIGALPVYLAGRHFRVRWGYAAFAGCLPGLAFLVGLVIAAIEVSIWIIIASPLFFIACSVGGLVMNLALRLADRFTGMRRSSSSLLLTLFMLPYALGTLENCAG